MMDRATDWEPRSQSARSVSAACFVLGVLDLVVINAALVPRYVEEREGGSAIASADPFGSDDGRPARLAPPPPSESRRAPVAVEAGGRAVAAAPRALEEEPPAPRDRGRAAAGEATGVERGGDPPRDLEEVAPIPFPLGSAELERDGRRQLWTVVWILRREAAARVLFRGGGDPESEPSAAASLGRARAEAAAAFVITQGNVDAARVSAASGGRARTIGEDGEIGQVEVLWR